MKKILFLSALLFLSAYTNAQQTGVSSMKNLTYPIYTVDTVTNTGTGEIFVNATFGYSNITIQPKVTKISGTMNSNSKPQLYGSIDGTNYYSIAGDTLHITNTSSPIVINWVLTQQNYKYYKITWTGSGTMSAKLEALVYVVNQR